MQCLFISSGHPQPILQVPIKMGKHTDIFRYSNILCLPKTTDIGFTMIHKTEFCGRKNHPFIMYLPNGMHKMMHPGV
jgi:hypothetical protein